LSEVGFSEEGGIGIIVNESVQDSGKSFFDVFQETVFIDFDFKESSGSLSSEKTLTENFNSLERKLDEMWRIS